MARDDVQLLDLQAVCERISKVPQATIAKLEGFTRGDGHELVMKVQEINQPKFCARCLPSRHLALER